MIRPRIDAPIGPVIKSPFGEAPTPPVPSFVMEIDTEAVTPGLKDFTLITSGTVNYDVDWGDSNSETVNATGTFSKTHTYTTAGTYEVTITNPDAAFYVYYNANAAGDLITSIGASTKGFNFGNTLLNSYRGSGNLTSVSSSVDFSTVASWLATWRDCTSLTSFPNLAMTSVTSVETAWFGCTGLTSFPALQSSSVLSFANAWNGCTGLTSFPLIDTSSGNTFFRAWYGCSGLTTFSLLSTGTVTNMEEAWFGCNSLTTFPLIDTSSCSNFYATWQSCSGLTSFPGINVGGATELFNTWRGCSGLTSFPVLVSCSSITSFKAPWRDCTGLTSFPVLDMSNATTIQTSWYGCSSLTSFPSISFGSALTNASTGWYNCSSLSTFPAGLFDACTSCADYTNAFTNCALSAASIENILVSIDTAGVSNGTININGGTNADASTWSEAAIAAYWSLIGKGWTITQNGTVPEPSFVMTIDTETRGAGLKDVYIVLASVNSYTVDWGDGNVEDVVSTGTKIHTYAVAGQYTITITNPDSPFQMFFNDSNAADFVIEIGATSNGFDLGTSLNASYQGAAFLNSVSADFDTSSIVTWDEAFRDASTIPSYPVLDTSAGQTFTRTWEGNLGLTTFPVLDFSSAVSLIRTWEECTGIVNFPVIDVSNVQDFTYTWGACFDIVTFPLLDFSGGTLFFGTWQNCQTLANFPANAFDTCTATNFTDAFRQCALTAQSIENILVSLDTAGQSNGTINVNQGTNAGKSNWTAAALAAESNLVARGWTITSNA